jgi:exonuclease VII small subunit|tara:strand:+ start:5799 stop:6053 length:255 start_codon:yes stop_codon:yes gene_type:complete
MKEKNLPPDIKNKSLNELRKLADDIIQNLEKEKDLEASLEEYQKLITLNNIIEKKFQNTSREISNNTKDKINKILNKKNGKKIK